jgi:hypothetical protein
MKQFQTTVIDFKYVHAVSFSTAPFEVAWASEAIYFIRVEEVSGKGASLTAHVQISVDGLTWVDEGTRLGPLTKTGDYFARVSHFGGFLRLRCELGGESPQFQITSNLVLKE